MKNCQGLWLLASLLQAQQPFVVVLPGLPAVLEHAPTPEKHQIETMPGGVAIFDFDNDGKPDIFLVHGASSTSNRLYRNLGNWKFTDVTGKSGLKGHGYGMGVAAADFDNDGFTDLLVTGVGFSTLYRNRGDGTFEDVTAKAGIPQTAWPISAGWFDFDNDGLLDLFIVNYCKWDPAKEPYCGDPKAGYRTYCHPKFYEGLPNVLLRNNGNGTFTDVSKTSGIGARIGKGMGLAFADYNGDGRLDVFVANDTVPNFLFRNDGGGKFSEVGMEAGVAINDDGKLLSSMGVDFRDIDNDGRPDLFFTALANETFPLFRNLANGLFQDLTYRSRIGPATLPHSGWGTGIYDFDNDGWKDIFAANGDVNDNTEKFSNRASRQRNQLLRNKGDGTFESLLLPGAARHRGVAFGDLDGDGRVDAVVTRLGETPVIYRNVMGSGNHWLRLELRGKASNRDAIGAVVRVGAQVNHVTTAVGYLGTCEKTVHFGLGSAAAAGTVEIAWPSGRKSTLHGVTADQVLRVTEP
jgi:hypothetical protein